jgi:hypothetical protein
MSQAIWIAYTPNSTVCRALGKTIHARFNTLPQATKYLLQNTLKQPAYLAQDFKNVKL